MNPRYAGAVATRIANQTGTEIRVLVQIEGLGPGQRLVQLGYDANSNSSHCPIERNISVQMCDWFAIQVDDGPSSWLNATATLGDDGQSLILTAFVGPGRSAIATRYGWNSWPVVWFYSQAGFPVIPW